MSVAKHDPLVAASLQNLDGFHNLLRATADSAALTLADAEGDHVTALYFLHRKLRDECDELNQRL